MKRSAASHKILDADITSLFANQAEIVSPADLDKRILEAADFAVRGVTSENYPTATTKKRHFHIVAIIMLVIALMYPLVKRFLDLPNTVQDSSRIFPNEDALFSSDSFTFSFLVHGESYHLRFLDT